MPSAWFGYDRSTIGGQSSSFTFQFSSKLRANDHERVCEGTGQNSLIPQILQQSYILSTPPRNGAAASSQTERGITAKSVICRSNWFANHLMPI